jgi:poly-gamma-glutamate synthesis protein (capsule biosynthesis protein)
VSVHWGANYKPVKDRQRRDARLIAEAGADVVLGHHSHDIQHVERIGRTFVLYSLGNYAWGAIGSPKLRVGLVASLNVEPRTEATPARVRSIELLPIVTQNRIVEYQPRRVRRREMRWVEPMVATSRAAGVDLQVDGTRLRLDAER